VFLGDAGFVAVFRRLSDGPSPLVHRTDGGPLRPRAEPGIRGVGRELLDAQVELTSVGEAVLDGEADHVAMTASTGGSAGCTC
jgi:hypothetical protein